MGRLGRDATLLHVGALAVGAVVLLIPVGPDVGIRLTVLVVAYAIATLLVARVRGLRDLLAVWRFATMLSVLLVLPDQLLVEGLGTLGFDPAGAPTVGAVPVYMAGLWAPALVPLLLIGDAIGRRSGTGWSYAAVAAAATVVFATAEALLPELPTWYAVDVTTIGSVALYVVPAEVALALAALATARRVRGVVAEVSGAAVVTVLYAGALGISWLLVEGALGATG